MADIFPGLNPRLIASVLVGRDSAGVHITWEFGETASAHPVEFLTYSVLFTGSRGSTLKQFGVKFVGDDDPNVRPYVFDFVDGNQANYDPNRVTLSANAISVHFVDASVGTASIDSATANLNINGVDLQERHPVSVID